MPKPTITNEQRHENLAEFMKNFLEKHHDVINGIQIEHINHHTGEHQNDHTVVSINTTDQVASDFIRMSNAWHKREESKVQTESPVELSETRRSIPSGSFRVSKTAQTNNDGSAGPVNGMHIVFRHNLLEKHLTFTALEQKLKQSKNLNGKITYR